MKKRMTSWIAPFILTGLTVVLSACSGDEEDLTGMGQKASAEFCECFKKNTKDKCLDNLADKYEYAQYMSDEFIKSFNEANTCDIELIIEKK